MDPVTIALRQEGLNDVKAALRDVQDAIAALDEFSANSAKNASRSRIRNYKLEAKERERLIGEKTKSPRSRKETAQDAFNRAFGGGGGGGVRRAFNRALGGGGGGGVRRASNGPSIAEQSNSMGSSLTSLATKAGVIGAAFGLMKSATDFAVDALKQFGGFLISDVIKPAFALETAAQQLENASGGQIKAAEIQEKTRSAALKHNLDPDVLLEAASRMVDLTGDAKTSFNVLDAVGTLAKSRGADPKQLAEFAATLKNFDPKASAEDIVNLLTTQLAQGDMGSVPLKEAAALGGRLTAPAAFLSGNTDVRLASMGALLQSGRKGFGSTDELVTGIGNLINEVTSQKMVGSKKYLNSEGQIGDVAGLIGGILKETGGDAKKISALGLSDPASKFVKAYLPTFNEAGKGDKGKEAVEGLIRGFMEARTSIDREKDNERKVLQTSGEKWNATIEGLKDKLLDVMPEVQKFVDKFAEVAPQFGGALVTLAKVMVKVANFLAGIFGTDETAVDFDTDETAVDLDWATEEARGEYRMNFETGQFEFMKQSQLNKEKESNPFSPDFNGMRLYDPPSDIEGFVLKGLGEKKEPEATNAEGNACLPDMSSMPANQSLPAAPPLTFPALQAPSTPAPQVPQTAVQADAAMSQLDALGLKAQKLGLVFDKVNASANDMARVKPISQR